MHWAPYIAGVSSECKYAGYDDILKSTRYRTDSQWRALRSGVE